MLGLTISRLLLIMF
uniref:Uncharacterized protein n=1 Tax=Rhizophora mucronata TaxID=61149 RepID=A0A2P2QVP2_RHIMU